MKSMTQKKYEVDPKCKPKGGVAVPFPLKMHQLLEEIEQDGLNSIVSWMPHGRSFVVHKPKEFVSDILPTYFKQSKIGSFQRQLNLYGFRRLTGGKDKGGYYHEFFLRGMPFLVHRIERITVKGTFVRGASSPDTEPDFYSMPWVEKDRDLFDNKLLLFDKEVTFDNDLGFNQEAIFDNDLPFNQDFTPLDDVLDDKEFGYLLGTTV